MRQQHKCVKCGCSFDPRTGNLNNLSWTTIFTRSNKALPLGNDIETFSLVKCPSCGAIQDAPELRLFGIIPRTQVKAVLGLLLAIILFFGYWLLRQD